MKRVINNDDIQDRLLRTLSKDGLINLLKSRTEKLKQADALIREYERIIKLAIKDLKDGEDTEAINGLYRAINKVSSLL